MNKKAFLLVASLFFLFGASQAHAGFGISPPYFKNDSLIRNSNYSQTIVLSRSDPVEDLNVKVIVDIPDANDWITVDKGLSFVMHQGESQVPMTIKAAIPG